MQMFCYCFITRLREFSISRKARKMKSRNLLPNRCTVVLELVYTYVRVNIVFLLHNIDLRAFLGHEDKVCDQKKRGFMTGGSNRLPNCASYVLVGTRTSYLVWSFALDQVVSNQFFKCHYTGTYSRF